jgi:hypothetical protein
MRSSKTRVSASGNVISGARVEAAAASAAPTWRRAISIPNGDPLTITEIRLPDDTAGSIGAALCRPVLEAIKHRLPAASYVYALNNANPRRAGACTPARRSPTSFVYTTSDGRGALR